MNSIIKLTGAGAIMCLAAPMNRHPSWWTSIQRSYKPEGVTKLTYFLYSSPMCSGEIINKRPRRVISSIQYLGGDDHASLRYVPSSRCKFLLLERERNRKVQGSRPVPPSSLAHRLTGGWPVFQVASGSRLMLLKQLCVSSERGFGVVVVGGKHKITVVWLVYWTPTLLL